MKKIFSNPGCTQFFFRHYGYFYCLLALGAIAWGRWDSILYPSVLNPDEMQAAANAMRIKAYGYSWNATDGSTVGPYNAIILCWPYFFGLEVTMSTVRLTTVLLLGGVFAFTYRAMKTVSGDFFAVLCSVPLAIFYALTKSTEFLHYSNEVLALTFMMLALELSFKLFKQRGSDGFSMAVLGLALGAVPFCKLQAAPIVFCMGVFSLYCLCGVQKVKRIKLLAVLVFSSLIPFFVLLAPLLFSATVSDFYNSYLLWATVYVQQSLNVLQLHKLVFSDFTLMGITYLAVVLILAGLLALSFSPRTQQCSASLTLYLCALFYVTVFVILRPGRLFPHYLMFLLPLVLLMAAYFCGSVELEKFKGWGFKAFCAALVLMFIYPVLKNSFSTEKVSQYKAEPKRALSGSNPGLFYWLSPKPSDRLLIWGSMPQWYVWSGMTPASREASTSNLIVKTKLQSYFRGRLIKDINLSAPDFVIDAVTGKSFLYNNAAKEGLRAFPELAGIIISDYDYLGRVDEHSASCPKFYVKKNRMAQLKKQLVEFESVTDTTANFTPPSPDIFAAKNVDDNSVTEDTCIDYWMPGDGMPGELTIRFKTEEQVKKLLVLNTKNGTYLDRSTRALRFSLLSKNKASKSGELVLKPYPQWTELVFDTPVPADTLRLEMLGYEGKGAGLNEVKVIRDSP